MIRIYGEKCYALGSLSGHRILENKEIGIVNLSKQNQLRINLQ